MNNHALTIPFCYEISKIYNHGPIMKFLYENNKNVFPYSHYLSYLIFLQRRHFYRAFLVTGHGTKHYNGDTVCELDTGL